MCDTVIATSEVTADGIAVFGKNSDREPNEAHTIAKIPAADHPADSRVQCTYVEIPQVEHTYAVLLAKPFWIWGAEMGANEHGVVIGNEAVFTKAPYEKGDALIGMDFLRLALERAATAREAVTVITDLLEEYGQGGNCGFDHELYYHNSFIIADAHNAWVLETAASHWAAKQVRGVYTISNGITITNEWDLASSDLVNFAIEKGWCKDKASFSFADCYSDFIYTRFSDCRYRCQRTTNLLSAAKGQITVATVMDALRDHGVEGDADWNPGKGITGANVCMHAGFGPIRGSQSVGSMVSHLHPEHPTHFLTGTSAPCTSIYKPFWLDADLPDMGPMPEGHYDAATLYWRHEALHRATLRDYATLMPLYADDRDALEKQFVGKALACADASVDERSAFAAQCFAEADAAETDWLSRLEEVGLPQRRSLLYGSAWKNFNQRVKMPF